MFRWQTGVIPWTTSLLFSSDLSVLCWFGEFRTVAVGLYELEVLLKFGVFIVKLPSDLSYNKLLVTFSLATSASYSATLLVTGNWKVIHRFVNIPWGPWRWIPPRECSMADAPSTYLFHSSGVGSHGGNLVSPCSFGYILVHVVPRCLAVACNRCRCKMSRSERSVRTVIVCAWKYG